MTSSRPATSRTSPATSTSTWSGRRNFVRFVYDGDGSAFGIKGPNSIAHIEDTFASFVASQGLASKPTAFDGRSDYDAFINVGIPAGGLFTGAEGIKTAEEAAVHGGTAGIAYDPATTRPATHSTTTATPAWTRCPMRSPTPPSRTQ